MEVKKLHRILIYKEYQQSFLMLFLLPPRFTQSTPCIISFTQPVLCVSINWKIQGKIMGALGTEDKILKHL